MAFQINGKHLPEGTSFYDANGNQYGSGWLNQATEAQKAAIGITWVADPTPVDTRFYWSEGNAKALEDKAEVKEDNTPLLDAKGNQVITKGLKSNFIAQVKDTAGKLLANTDWYVIRKAERNVDIPAKVVSKREAIVTEANRLETAIVGVANVEALIEVLNGQNWGE